MKQITPRVDYFRSSALLITDIISEDPSATLSRIGSELSSPPSDKNLTFVDEPQSY